MLDSARQLADRSLAHSVILVDVNSAYGFLLWKHIATCQRRRKDLQNAWFNAASAQKQHAKREYDNYDLVAEVGRAWRRDVHDQLTQLDQLLRMYSCTAQICPIIDHSYYRPVQKKWTNLTRFRRKRGKIVWIDLPPWPVVRRSGWSPTLTSLPGPCALGSIAGSSQYSIWREQN